MSTARLCLRAPFNVSPCFRQGELHARHGYLGPQPAQFGGRGEPPSPPGTVTVLHHRRVKHSVPFGLLRISLDAAWAFASGPSAGRLREASGCIFSRCARGRGKLRSPCSLAPSRLKKPGNFSSSSHTTSS